MLDKILHLSFDDIVSLEDGVDKETKFLNFIVTLALEDNSPLSRHLMEIEAFTLQDGLVANIEEDEVFISADNGLIHCSLFEFRELLMCRDNAQFKELLCEIF